MICVLCSEKNNIQKHHIVYGEKEITIPVCVKCHNLLHSLKKEEPNKRVIKLSCGNCGYEWNYKGVNPYFGCCPSCLRKVSIKKREIK